MELAALVTALGSGFPAVVAASVFFSTLARPPPGWCFMFSVEPTLERTLFRSGAETVVAKRLTLGAEELGLVEVGFLSTERATEDRQGADMGLTRVEAIPAGGVAPVGVVFLFTELAEVVFERLKSAVADLAVILLTSAGFPSVLVVVGLLGRVVDGLLLLDPVETRVEGDVALEMVGVVLGPGLRAGADEGLDGEVRFSATLVSVIGFGFRSLAGRVEGLAVAVAAAGRLCGAAGTEPEARLMGFLFNPPEVVGAGCLGREVGCILAFDVEVFAG